MKDQSFINITVKRGQEVREKVEREFSDISPEQLNWKPSPTSWSIAECLDHLLIADGSYFDDLNKIAAGTYKMNFLEKYSPFTYFCGKILKDQLREKVNKKMTAPKKFTPTASNKPSNFVQTYLENLCLFLGYISKCGDIDVDKTTITSPIYSIVTYSLRDAFKFLIEHEHRHINQAIRVKENDAFPNKDK